MPKPVATVNQEFRGLYTNVNPHSVPQGGSTVQINVQVVKHGQLDVRNGLRVVRFDN